jgi:hypothetical protein
MATNPASALASPSTPPSPGVSSGTGAPWTGSGGLTMASNAIPREPLGLSKWSRPPPLAMAQKSLPLYASFPSMHRFPSLCSLAYLRSLPNVIRTQRIPNGEADTDAGGTPGTPVRSRVIRFDRPNVSACLSFATMLRSASSSFDGARFAILRRAWISDSMA